MQARYYPDSDFLNASVGSNPSYLWRSIIAAQGVVKQGARKRIGNGETTRVWKIPWLPDPVNGYLTTVTNEQLQDIHVQNLFDETQKGWDVDILQDICNERDRNLILQIPIPTRSREDSWYWMLEDKGEFTVRSCYRKIQGEFECADGRFWRKLWGLQLPGKVVNFLWRACRNVLPTAMALHSKHVNLPVLCSWCHIHVEDAVHTLFNCCIAKEVWNSVGLQELVRNTTDDNVMTVLKRIFNAGDKDTCVMVGLFCWSL